MTDIYSISGRIYPAKSSKLELIDLVKEVMHADYQHGDRVLIPRTTMDRIVADLEHGVLILDALQDTRDEVTRYDFAERERVAAVTSGNGKGAA